MSSSYRYPHGPIKWIAKPHDFAGDTMLGIYAIETTQRYIYGTRLLTWDGKVYKYGKAVAALTSGFGVFNNANDTVADMLNTATTIASVIGDKKWTLTVGAAEGYAGGGDLTLDELAGGYMTIGHGAGTPETHTIVGNEAVTDGGTCIVTNETPFANAYAIGSFQETQLNPYRYQTSTASEVAAVMSVAIVAVASGSNFWGQTWGPCWVTPGGGDATPGDSVNDREVYFVGDGSVNGATALTIENGYQRAGFIIDTTEVGTGTMPLVMLQISI